MSSIGVRIRKARNEKEMSQLELAKAMEVQQTSIARWENENVIPSAEVIGKISDILNVTCDYLIKGENKMETKVYELKRNSIEVSYKKSNKIVEGCAATALDAEPDVIKTFNNSADALKELKKYQTSITQLYGGAGLYYLIEEYYVEENVYDEDGEFVTGGDIYGITEMPSEY